LLHKLLRFYVFKNDFSLVTYDDVAVTRAIVQAGKLLDVDVLDHMVIGQGKWVSLKERGLGFN
jgi:hypothetical protein